MLKVQLLAVLAALSNAGGPIFRAIVVLVSAAVNKFVPDTIVGVAPLSGAAPDAVKTTLFELFNKAAAYLPTAFLQKMVASLLDTVLSAYLDQAWDAVFGPAVATTVKPDPEDAILFAKCCE